MSELYKSAVDLGRFRAKIIYWISLTIGVLVILTSIKLLLNLELKSMLYTFVIGMFIILLGWANLWISYRFEIVALAHGIASIIPILTMALRL
jgi:hypothetical protein